MNKEKLKPCEPPSSQKKHKNHRRCKWQFNTICLGYIDINAINKGYALYRDRQDVSHEECAQRFLPIDDKLANGEEYYCRCPSVFVEIESSRAVKRTRNQKTRKVDGYMETLFETEPTVGMTQRPESGQEY